MWGTQEKHIDLFDGRLDRVMRRLNENRAMGDGDIPSKFFEAVRSTLGTIRDYPQGIQRRGEQLLQLF